jgi:pimeloyl-ACP methyl ester carboxylesterase
VLFLLSLCLAKSSFAAPVRDQVRLEVDAGVEVFLEVAGQDDNAPLLLFLHGGPGSVGLGLVPFQVTVGRQLEQDFLVAYLHQRGAGHSDAVPAAQQTFENLVNDVDQVVEYLLQHYGDERLYVVGHSVGGMLAGLYASEHPEKIGGLVLCSTAMNFKAMLRDSLEVTLEWAKTNEVVDAVEQLGRIDESFDTWRDFGALNQWANQGNGGVTAHFDMEAFLADNRIDEEFPNWRDEQLNAATALYAELKELDLDEEISAFDIPALFVSGEDDTISPINSVRRDYANYGGSKKLVVLEDSHHLPFIDQTDLLAREIRDFLMTSEK